MYCAQNCDLTFSAEKYYTVKMITIRQIMYTYVDNIMCPDPETSTLQVNINFN